MRLVIRIVRTHALLVAVLWLISHVEWLSQCGGCAVFAYVASFAFIILIFPGLWAVGELIPIIYPDTISFDREVASLAATDLILFLVLYAVFVLPKIIREAIRA